MLMTERFYTKRETEAGISESIGFLLIFTIIIAGIGLVSLYGYPMLLQQQTNADESIMEKNMIVLQNDIKSLAYKTVPYKETALKIGSGTLTAYNYSHSPAMRIVYDSSVPYDETFQSGELLYESISAQTNISIENGAVIKQPRLVQGSTMLAEPRWFYDGATRTMVINLINFNTSGDETLSRSGVGTVRMRLNETVYTSNSGSNVAITYLSDYDVAWRNFLMDDNGLDMNNFPAGSDTYTKNNVNTLVVKKFYIVIEAV
jgi:hypothetical protein